MAAADGCSGFPTDISAVFNVPTSSKILTCSRLLWGPRSFEKLKKCHKCHKSVASTGLFSDVLQISTLRSYVSLSFGSDKSRILMLATFTF